MNQITDADVTTIITSILKANDDAATGRTTYLRTLIAATQDVLQKKRGQDTQTQVAALNGQHKRFYEIALAAVEPFVLRGTKDRAVEVHRRVNFARTSLSIIRRWTRVEGNDICALNPGKATRTTLAVAAGPPRPQSRRRLRARVESQSKSFIASLIGLADTDKAAAIEEIQLVLGQLTTQLVSLGVVSTKESAQAIAEHRPLRIGKQLFLPTQTQVIRQRARPS